MLVSAVLLVSAALETTALDVSGTVAAACGIALVTEVAGWAGPAEASFMPPAFTCTVFTRTGFIGSAEPGMRASGCVWITPEVIGAGSTRAVCADGTAAVACAIAADIFATRVRMAGGAIVSCAWLSEATDWVAV